MDYYYTLSTPPTDGHKKTGCPDSVAIDSQMLGLIFGTLLGDYSTIYVRPTSSAPLSQASAAEGRNCRLLDEMVKVFRLYRAGGRRTPKVFNDALGSNHLTDVSSLTHTALFPLVKFMG